MNAHTQHTANGDVGPLHSWLQGWDSFITKAS